MWKVLRRRSWHMYVVHDSLPAIQEGAQQTGLVDSHLGVLRSKRLTSLWRASPEWAVRDASSANSNSLTYTSVTFVLVRRRARLNSFSSDLVCRYIQSQEESKAYDRRREKKIPNNFGARTQPCLTPLQTGRGSNVEPSYTTVPFMSSWKETTMLRSLGGQPIFLSRRKSPFLLTTSKALVKSMNTT